MSGSEALHFDNFILPALGSSYAAPRRVLAAIRVDKVLFLQRAGEALVISEMQTDENCHNIACLYSEEFERSFSAVRTFRR